MKQILVLTILVANALSQAYGQGASVDIMYLPKGTEIIIDGSESDWPDVIPYEDFNYYINDVEPPISEDMASDKPFSPADLSAYFRVAWDTSFLYLFIAVEDDIDGVSAEKLKWQSDAIQIYVNPDLGNDPPFTGESNYLGTDGILDAIEMRISRDSSLHKGTKIDQDWKTRGWNYEFVLINKPASYELEIKLPIDSLFTNHINIGDFQPDGTPLSVKPEAGLTFGFELMIVDQDESPSTHDNWNRDGFLAWANQSQDDDSYMNTELFGTATLLAPVTAVNINAINAINLFPSITNGQIFLEGHSEIASILMFNSLGKMVKVFYNPDSVLDMSELNNGLYIISITDINGQMKTYKILKQ